VTRPKIFSGAAAALSQGQQQTNILAAEALSSGIPPMLPVIFVNGDLQQCGRKSQKCGLTATERRQKPVIQGLKSHFPSTNYLNLLIMMMFELIRTQKREGLCNG
jgi:hypothetical protein